MIFPHPPDIVNNVIKAEVISEDEEKEFTQVVNWQRVLLEHKDDYGSIDCNPLNGGKGLLHIRSVTNGVGRDKVSESAFPIMRDGSSMKIPKSYLPADTGQPSEASKGKLQNSNTNDRKTSEDLANKKRRNNSKGKRKGGAKALKSDTRKSNSGKVKFVTFKYTTTSLKREFNKPKGTKSALNKPSSLQANTTDMLSTLKVNACTLENQSLAQQMSKPESQNEPLRNSLSSLSHGDDRGRQLMVQKQPAQYGTSWSTTAYGIPQAGATIEPSLLLIDSDYCQHVGPGTSNNSHYEDLLLDQMFKSTNRYNPSSICWDQNADAEAARFSVKGNCMTSSVSSYMQAVFKQESLRTFESEAAGGPALELAHNKPKRKESTTNATLQSFEKILLPKDINFPSADYLGTVQRCSKENPEPTVIQRVVPPTARHTGSKKANSDLATYKHYNWSSIEVPKLTDYFHAQIVVKSNGKKKAMVKKLLQRKNFKRLSCQFEPKFKPYQFRMIDILLHPYIGKSEDEMLCVFLSHQKRSGRSKQK